MPDLPDLPDGEALPDAGASVSLREVTAENLRAILTLKVAEKQQGYVAPNAVSIAEAHYTPGAWFRAIYADDTPVGFAMTFEDRNRPLYMLWRFMVDERYQRRGFGRRALELVIDRVRTLPGATELLLTHVPGEHGPEAFYRRLGFEHTGEERGRELEMRISLDGAHSGTARSASPGR